LGFTEAIFFHPDEIASFMDNFPIKKIVISGAEGPFAQSEEKLKNLDQKILKEWIDFSFEYAAHPSILGSI
jgi:hypothetical protein